MPPSVAPLRAEVPTLIELFDLDRDLAAAVDAMFGAHPAAGSVALADDTREHLAALGICNVGAVPSPRPIADAIEAGWRWREGQAHELDVRNRAEAAAQHHYLLSLASADEKRTIGGGGDELNEWFARIQLDAHEVVDALPVVPPADVRIMAALNADPAVFALCEGFSARGVRTVNIAARQRLDQFRERASYLKEATLPGNELWEGSVPLRLAVIDGQTTIIPRDLDDHDLAVIAVTSVEVATIANALIRATARPVRATPAPHVDDCGRRVLSMLSRGHTDEAIARRLGVSDRTVRRMVAQLMADMGADSRFQLGMRAAHAGLL